MWKSWYWKPGAGHILDPIKHLWWSFIAKIFCKGSNYFGNSYVNLDYYLYDPAWMSQSIKVLSHDPVHNRLWSPEKSHEDIILMWPLQMNNLKKIRKTECSQKKSLFLSVCNIILRNSCLWISFWFSAVNYFWNTHHLRCLTEFWKRLWSPKTHNRFSNSNWFLSFQFLYILHLP